MKIQSTKKGELIRLPNEKRSAILFTIALFLSLYVGFDLGATYKILTPQVVKRGTYEDIITYQKSEDIDVLAAQPLQNEVPDDMTVFLQERGIAE